MPMAALPSSSGGTDMSISGIMKRLQDEQNAANLANDTRYNHALSSQATAHASQQNLYNNAYNDVQNVGNVARQRIQKNYMNASGAGRQSLISRGLGNTTIMDSVLRGYADDAELQQQGVDEQQAQLRSGLRTQQAQNEGAFGDRIAGIMERRNDTGPDTGLYSNLIQAAMASQTGSQKTSTTQYVGPDGRVYNNPGSALSSGGGMGGGGGGGTTTTTQGGGNFGSVTTGGGGGSQVNHGTFIPAQNGRTGWDLPAASTAPTIAGTQSEVPIQNDPNAGKRLVTGNSPGVDALTGQYSQFPRYYV